MNIKHRLPLITFAFVLAAGQTALAQQAESRNAKFEGARVHYLNYGKGDEALVLIHGWTMNADNWRDNIADLAARNRVIVIELPGHGQSDKPEQQKSEVSDPRSGRDSQAPPLYSMEHFA